MEIHSQVVHIIGAVPQSGAHALSGPLTVVELLSRAGGLNEFAKRRQIQIVRTQGNVTTRFLFDYDAYLEGKFHQNIPLRAGDIVTVP
jgi:polysaccharide export outer membrane protein